MMNLMMELLRAEITIYVILPFWMFTKSSTQKLVKKFSFRELASLRYDQVFIQLFWQYSVFVLMSEFLQPKFIEAGSRGAGAVNPHCGVHWQSPWKLCYFEAPELFCLWFWSAWCQHHKHFQCMSKLLHESKNLHKHKE